MAYLDIQKLNEHFDSDKELIGQILEIFETSYQEYISKMKESVGSNNNKDLEISAHTLKGMISNFFAEDLRLVASQIESMGKTGDVTKDVNEKIEFLVNEIPKLIIEIKAII